MILQANQLTKTAIVSAWLCTTITSGLPTPSLVKNADLTPKSVAVATDERTVGAEGSVFWTLEEQSGEGSEKCAVINNGRCITSDESLTSSSTYGDFKCRFRSNKPLTMGVTHYDLASTDQFVVHNKWFTGTETPDGTGACARSCHRLEPLSPTDGLSHATALASLRAVWLSTHRLPRSDGA